MEFISANEFPERVPSDLTPSPNTLLLETTAGR